MQYLKWICRSVDQSSILIVLTRDKTHSNLAIKTVSQQDEIARTLIKSKSQRLLRISKHKLL